MENPVLQNSVEVEEKSKKKLYLVIGTLLILLFLSLLLIVVLLTSKPVEKIPEPTPIPNPVSTPTIKVGEPTPTETPSTLTKYTFDADYGFNMMYDASKWEVTTEPQAVYESVYVSADKKYTLTLQPIGNHASENEIRIYFKKMLVSAQSGNVQAACSADYKILKEQGVVASDGTQAPGLIRVYVQGNGYAYSHYYSISDDASQRCINIGIGIYAIESVPGGEGVASGDINDIYWVALATTGPTNPYITEVDQMVSTIKFQGQ